MWFERKKVDPPPRVRIIGLSKVRVRSKEYKRVGRGVRLYAVLIKDRTTSCGEKGVTISFWISLEKGRLRGSWP